MSGKNNVRERPLIRSAMQVRAIQHGATQFRVPIKPQPSWCDDGFFKYFGKHPFARIDEGFADWALSACPYGVPGDRLWVRETYYLETRENGGFDQWTGEHDVWEEYTGRIWYAADGEPPMRYDGAWWEKRASIHMFRKHSRILLEITDVRVGRLQDISEEDAENEGAAFDNPIASYHKFDNGPQPGYKYGFQCLWDSIYAKRGYSWTSNPWVWVIEFKVL